jgi:aminoacylase
MLNKLMALREEERQRLAANPALTLGDVTTVNLTIMEGGVQARVQHENLLSYSCGNSFLSFVI